jgi:hypothetical protein
MKGVIALNRHSSGPVELPRTATGALRGRAAGSRAAVGFESSRRRAGATNRLDAYPVRVAVGFESSPPPVRVTGALGSGLIKASHAKIWP